MSISGLYILDNRGKVLISRDYRGDADHHIGDFMKILNESEDPDAHIPIIYSNKASFAYLKENNLFLVCVIKKNANITLTFTFLRKFLSLLTEYFKELEEESIHDNFVIIHELLDEVMDYGYPQITDPKILQVYITQEGYKLRKKITVPAAVTNCVSWRPEGIQYKSNEVFLDLVESVNLVMDSNGRVLTSDVFGAILMKVHLSGMPQLRLGFSDKLILDSNNNGALEDIKFHQCVQLSRFNNEKTIYFVPPDGDFELMTYRLNPDINPIFLVDCQTEIHPFSRIEYSVTVKSQFKKCAIAHNLNITFPVPNDVDSPVISTNMGNAKYQPEESAVLWQIKAMPGRQEYFMRASFQMTSFKSEEEQAKTPILIKFSIPYFTISKLHIRYIKIIERGNYKALTWIRYTTQNGDYQIRT